MFYPIDLVERGGVKKQTLSDFFRVNTSVPTSLLRVYNTIILNRVLQNGGSGKIMSHTNIHIEMKS